MPSLSLYGIVNRQRYGEMNLLFLFMEKIIIYQLLVRLFGNDNKNRVYNGTIEQNGCGKLNDFTSVFLGKLKKMGFTHVWFTGLLEHATQTSYIKHGIRNDHPAMVKGKAGSPYAIKDYYDICPDLASTPEFSFTEFRQILKRTHRSGLRFIMDFVPNHVARQYHSDSKPEEVRDLGADDNSHQAFTPMNNFYYIPNTPLHCSFDMKGNAAQPYEEVPAKATGNDCFTPSPGVNDWYETVKLNYGIDYTNGHTEHFNPIPSTWHKMLDILLFWAKEGVDGFRCDMAEMVPCSFWHWAIAKVKAEHPDILFIGEVYNPQQYHSYIFNGGFDYLYDKVGLYDTLRAVTCHTRPASDITKCWQAVDDIQGHMLNFLENHDEQRLASDFFAGTGLKGKPAAIVSLCLNTNPFMLYFGQALGERGMDNEGYSGIDGRTTIFDYWSLPSIQAWRGKGKYNKINLTKEQKNILTFYEKLLKFARYEPALRDGSSFDLMYANYDNPKFDTKNIFAFIRHTEHQFFLIVVNFCDRTKNCHINIPQHAFDVLKIPKGTYEARNLLNRKSYVIPFNSDEPVFVVIPGNLGVLLKITY